MQGAPAAGGQEEARARSELSHGEQLVNMLDLEAITGFALRLFNLPCSFSSAFIVLLLLSGHTYVYSAAEYRARYAEGVRPCLPPPFVAQPKKLFPHRRHPLLTKQSGTLLPGVPKSLAETLEVYGQPGTHKLPNVDVQERNMKGSTVIWFLE